MALRGQLSAALLLKATARQDAVSHVTGWMFCCRAAQRDVPLFILPWCRLRERQYKTWTLRICVLLGRSVTYQFFSLPFCTPKEKQYKIEGLGEVLEGDRLVNTPYSIKFRVDKENDVLCSIELNQKDLQKFRTAVKNDYYFQARPWEGLRARLLGADGWHVRGLRVSTRPGRAAHVPAWADG